MKVLRTALLSTLLIICFGHVSHAQLLDQNICDHTIIDVVGGSMTYLDGKLTVVYDATVMNGCNEDGYTEVTWNGIVVYSQTFESGTFGVAVTVDVSPDGIREGQAVDVECTACQGDTCHREGGTVQFTGG